MDEILHAPQHSPSVHTPRTNHSSISKLEGHVARAKDGMLRFAEAAEVYGRRFHLQGTRVLHHAHSATAGKRMAAPLPFLALSAVLGIACVVSYLYTPSYVVAIDGVNIGSVRSQSVFEQVENRVEVRASAILDHAYTLDHTVDYSFALTERGQLTPIANFETYLFDQIGEVMKSYVLTVDGTFIGAAADRTTLDTLLTQLSAPYIGETTRSSDFVQNVHIAREYTPSDVRQDTAEMMAALTANTTGQTTYEVQRGDTFMALAFDNGMTMEELTALNPDVNINRLYIGQILNVKEIVPFLSVKTVDAITYDEPIECPVREVTNDQMYQGDSKVLESGVPGVQTLSAEITAINGKEQERNITATVVVREPTEKVISVGTLARPSWIPNGYYIWPTYGHITSPFGYRSIFGTYSYHSGIDIAVPYGSAVKAADGGTVTWSGYKGSLGNLVIIDHGNGEQTYYGHNSSLTVNVGEKVYQGQTVAKAGSTGRSTGTHCHFELKINGTSVNPRSYLN